MSRGNALRGFAATLAASTVAAIALTVVAGAGADDIGAFVWWTTPFALLVGIASRVVVPRLRRGRRRIVAPVGGALFGLVWAVLVALALGPFFLLFSFPAALAWIAGGAIGAVAGSDLSGRAERAARIGAYGTIGALLLLLVALPLVAVVLNDGADVVAHVRADATESQVNRFAESLLDDPAVEGVSHDVETVEVFLVEGATEAERERVRARVARSPLVARVER